MTGLLLRFALLLLPAVLLGTPMRGVCNNSRPDIVGTQLGVYDVSQGASWADLTSALFKCSRTQAACTAGYVFTELVVVNTHATQTLYVMLRASSGETTAKQIAVAAGDSLTLPVYGMQLVTISIQGSGAATTGRILAWLAPN